MMGEKAELEKLSMTVNGKFIVLTILLIFLYSTILFAQNIVYINPENVGDPNENGSYDHPFSSWKDLNLQTESNTTYLQKRGTVDTAWVTYFDGVSNVKCGAYGPGNILPKIVSHSDNGAGHPNGLFNVTNGAHHITIDSLHLTGVLGTGGYDPVLIMGVKISGSTNPNSLWPTNISITNCEIAYAGSGIITLKFQTGVDSLLIDNCKIHDILAEGIFSPGANMTVRNCHLYRINMAWHYNGHTHAESGGDAIQMSPGNSISGTVLIENNIIDRRETGNKFCFIYNDLDNVGEHNLIVRYNTFYPPKDTADDEGGAAMYLKKFDTAWIYGNKFIGKGYATTERPESVAQIQANKALYFYYNLLDSVGGFESIGPINDKDLRVFNNTFVDMPGDRTVMRFLSDSLHLYNNIIAMHSGATLLTGTSANKVDSANNLIQTGSPENWDVNFGFVNWQNGDYHITNGSPAHNTGVDYYGYPYNFYFDNDSVQVPQGITRDIGALEFDEGGASNSPPQVENQEFYIDENSTSGTQVGIVVASDYNTAQTLTFSIISGNTDNAFEINSSTGELTVVNSTPLNFEVNPVIDLIVQAKDNGLGTLTGQGVISVNLNDVNENPNITNQSFNTNENEANGVQVGIVNASDPDTWQTLSYQIISGNTDNAFQISSATGILSVANSVALDYESCNQFTLTIKVTDNGSGNLTDQAVITVNLNDVNEAPEIVNQTFSLEENSYNGYQLGNIIANDPDAGQSLTYTILSGNTGSAFYMETTTGLLIVLNNSFLNYEIIPEFNLLVEVTDNGQGNLSEQATITISITDVNEVPQIEDLVLPIDPFMPDGSEVGQVIASDPDNGQSITFEIIDGNTDNAFAIGPGTGLISVVNSNALDPSVNPIFVLTIQVTDNGAGNLFAQGAVTLTFEETNQQPIMNNQTFTLAENTQNGQQAGTVVAIDPDAGQNLTFTIMAGNTDGAFIINPSTGELTVENSTALNFESIPAFILLVEVEDDGIGNLTDQAIITVQLTDVNEVPQIENLVFTIDPFMPDGSEVGQVIASDPDNGQTITFEIIDGNTDNAFALNPGTGIITVANSNVLDPTINPMFTLTVEVSDNGAGNLSSQGTVALTYDETNQQPQINNQAFTLAENTQNGQQVGMVIAVDPNIGQNLTYSIITGNTDGAFQINPVTGELTVENSTALNFESIPAFLILVEVEDDGIGNLTDQAIITVELSDVNEPPGIVNQTFWIEENSNNGFEVGNVVASDPDAGQSIAYTIVSGNTDNAFYLESTTGLLTVLNNSILDFEVTPEFNLLIEVEDNGAGNLSAQATITISLIDVFEPPLGINNDNQANNEMSFHLFPNPAGNHINVSLRNLEVGTIYLTIADVNGNVVLEEELNSMFSELKENINVNELAHGLYFVKVRNGFIIKQVKFLKL